ncbi:MAG: hypothetical protein IPP94_00525 [Ignavibacteria bacterium]|nr:hypothetical protein [Ignavibacteria bacterium]
MTVRTRFVRMIPILMLAVSFHAQAQLTLVTDSVDISAFPKISVRTVARQGGLLRKDIPASDFTLKEDGISQSPLTIRGTRGARSFCLGVLVAGGSMVNSGDISAARAAIEKIIDSLEFPLDEGAIYSYSTNGTTLIEPTTSKQLLGTGAANLSSNVSGPNHLYEGLWHSLGGIAGETTGINALLLMSNGLDDGSAKTFTDVVTFAKNSRIKIFTLGIAGIGGAATLQNLSTETGGQYFTNTALAIETVVNLLRETPDHFFVEYTTNNQCRDGVARSIALRVRSGNDSAQSTRPFDISANPASNISATFKVDTGGVALGKTILLRVLLQTAMANQRFYPATAELSFDTSKLKLTKVEVDSSLIPDNTVSFSTTASGASLSIAGTSVLSGPGRLLKLFFTGADVTQNTTVPVTMTSLTFTRGCLMPVLVAGSVQVLPKNYGLTGSSKPYTFVWNTGTNDYDPAVEVIKADITNTGDLPVTGLTATLPASADYTVVQGSTAVAAVVPSSLLPGEKGTAQWRVRAVPRADEKGQQIDVPFTCAEGATGTAKIFLNIKAATSAATMLCAVESITIVGGTHTPMPARVTAVVKSAGTATGPAGTVSITLPGALTLRTGTTTQAFSALAPGTTQTLTWGVEYPTNLPAPASYDIALVMSGTGRPNDTSGVTMVVPVATAPNVVTGCITHSPVIAYDSVAKRWPPFQVTARVRNTGGGTSASLSAELALPPQVLFAPGETIRKTVSPGLAGGDSADVTWNVQAAGPGCADRTGQFKYRFYEGTTLKDSCTSQVTILRRPNLAPEITGRTPATTDSLTMNSNHTFTVNAKDADGDAIIYAWFLDGAPVGTNQNSITQTFPSTAPHTLRCVLTDPCGDSAVTIWTFRIVTDAPATLAAAGFAIRGNSPNPFSPQTLIEFTVPDGEHDVVLDVTDASGRVVAVLVSGRLAGGTHRALLRTVSASGATFANGVYFARLRSGGASLTHPMLLAR